MKFMYPGKLPLQF